MKLSSKLLIPSILALSLNNISPPSASAETKTEKCFCVFGSIADNDYASKPIYVKFEAPENQEDLRSTADAAAKLACSEKYEGTTYKGKNYSWGGWCGE